jgi:tetratricopeptide (TPR) repeat protein
MKIVLIVFSTLLVLTSAAQSKQQKKIDRIVQDQMEKIYGKPIESPAEYKQAEQLAQLASAELVKGNINRADSLIDQSIALYPTKAVIAYCAELCKLPDLKQANAVAERMMVGIKKFPKQELIFLEAFPATYVNGKMERGFKNIDKQRVLFSMANEVYYLNREFGDIKTCIKWLTVMSEIPIENTTDDEKNTYDYEFNVQRGYKIYLLMAQKEYDKAIALAEAMPVTKFNPKESIDMQIAGLYFEKGDYEKALKIIESLPETYALTKDIYKFMAYSMLGKNTEALDHYNKYRQMPGAIQTNNFLYYLAIIDMNKSDYNGALRNLDSALHYRITGDNAWMAGMQLVDRWKLFKAIGDAYTGLRQYDKAKDNYNIALLADPDYEPAIAALTKLESSIATTTSTDKTPPSIAVTEPSVKRGLQVTTSGNDVMVRGIAEDPSGLKSVSINGQSVYAQASGNFWGNIVLKDGLNKITIKATDGAGNIAEQTFEITKNNTPAPETEIVAVTAKEGKNYCLLIAAQNYSDVTIPSLENPIQDAVRLKLVLKKNYNFTDENIITLFNPNANDIKRQLLELTNVIQPEDNLLIFYAGHGIWVEKEKKGYWLMTDAKRNDPNTWVSNKDVLNLIAKLPSRHTLLITDACFSGGVFKTRSITKDAPSAIQMMDAKVSRVAITSGNDTEVPDQSVFMKYLVKALSENKEQYLPAQKMFITHIMEAVMTEGKTEPRYGTLELAGHVGGDYIFSKK